MNKKKEARLAFRQKRLIFFALMASFFFAVDFFSKIWVNHHFGTFSPSSASYPYGGIGVFQQFLGVDFCLNRVTNQGAAWGVFASHSHFLLIVRMTIIVGFFGYILFMNKARSRDVPFVLILTGAVGNLFDVFCYGHVIDFLHFTFWGYSYPVFNFSDVMIFCGVVLLLLQSLRKKDGSISTSSRAASQ